MKLQITNRTKVLLGGVVLAGAAAAAWFLYLQDWLAGPPPAPVASAPKPQPVPLKPEVMVQPAKPEPAKPVAAKEAPKPAAMKAPPKPVVSPEARALAREAAAKPAPKAPAPEPVKVEPEPAPVMAESPKPEAAEPSKPAAEAPRPAPVSLVPAALRGPSVPGPRFNDLVTAVLYRDVAGVEELLRFGKWPDKADSRGTTPLMIAVDQGDATIAEALLKAGADPGRAMTIARAKSPAFVSLLERYSRATP